MIGKCLYLEFLVPVNDYIETLKPKEALFDWLLPFVLSVFCYSFISYKKIALDLDCIIGPIVNFLAILIGFSIACISVLSTSDNDNIKKLKEERSTRKTGDNQISLYQHILITYIFSVIIELSCLLLNLTFLFAKQLVSIDAFNVFLYSVDVFLLAHIVFLNIRNVTNFYFVFWKN